MERDPVCGMNVIPDQAAATSTYNGKTYYFCAVACKDTFDREPAKYIHEPGDKGHGCCSGS